jgi:hypothetical protein
MHPHRTDPDAVALEYVRRARQLRALLGHAPSAPHRSLAQLGSAGGPHRARGLEGIDEPARSAFSRDVIDRLDGTVLRQSMRRELFRLADRKGLSRFEANLVIAQVQHRAAAADRFITGAIAGGQGLGGNRSRLAGRALPWLVAAGVQAAIGIGAWIVLSQ